MSVARTPVKFAAAINRAVLPESTAPDYQFKYVDIAAVDGSGAMTLPEEWTQFASAPSRARRTCPSGSTVISTVRTYLRAVATVPESADPLVFSTGFATLEAQHGTDPRFLSYACRSDPFIDAVVARSTGVSYPAINPTDLGQVPIPLPPLEEQRRIADFLDDQTSRINRIIAAREAQIGLDRQAHASEVDAQLEYAGSRVGWTTLRRRLVRIQQGWSPDCDQSPAAQGEWGVLKVGAVKRGRFRAGENKRLPASLEPRLDLAIQPRDLLFTRANTRQLVGDCCVVPDGVPSSLILCDKIMRVTLDRATEPDFVAIAALGTRARGHFSALASGTSGSMVNIRGEDVQDMPIPDAPAALQRSMVDSLISSRHGLERRVGLLGRSVDLFQEFKRSLISAAVSGEFDVAAASGRGVPA